MKKIKNIIQGRRAQRSGARTEDLVAHHLRYKYNCFIMIQNTKSTVIKGKKVFIKKQGVDLVGHVNIMADNNNDENKPKPIYVECKCSQKESLGLGLNSSVKPDQLDFLASRESEGCISLIAWYKENQIALIPCHRYKKYLREHKRKSMPWTVARSFVLKPAL